MSERTRRLLRALLNLAALAFVAWTARRLADDWQQREPVTVHWAWVAAAWFAVLGNNVAQAHAWVKLILDFAATRAPYRALFGIYAASHLGRYVPGKVAMAVMRAEAAAPHGVPSAAVYSSIVVELVSWLAGASVVALCTAALSADGGLGALLKGGAWGLLAAVGVGVALLMRIDRNRLPEAWRGRLRLREGRGPLLPVSVPPWHVVQFASWGLSGWLLGLAVGATPVQALVAVPYFVLAPMSGMVAVGAPAGIGVREAVMVAGLQPAVGPAGALAAAGLSRACAVSMDVVVWLATRHLVSAETPPPAPPRPGS